MYFPCTPKLQRGAALTSMKGSHCQKALLWLSSLASPLIFPVMALGVWFCRLRFVDCVGCCGLQMLRHKWPVFMDPESEG